MTTTRTRWNRHTDTCTGITATGKDCKGCESGSTERAQRRLYALHVLSALTGEAVADVMTCPLTGLPFAVETGEVDRTTGDKYAPGFVILVSREGNAARGILQSAGQDVRHAARYAADVLRVSQGVPVPRLVDAKAWHEGRGKRHPLDVLAGGLYS